MHPDDYQELAYRTANGLSDTDALECACYGLAGECGELIDHVKKWRFQGHDLDYDYIRKELGDIAWYLALGATATNTPLDDIFHDNIEKLRDRYPDGFDSEISKARYK